MQGKSTQYDGKRSGAWVCYPVFKQTLVLICLLLSGCAAPAGKEQAGHGVEFTDALGRTVTVSNPQRVGICSGSLAECWLLAGGEVCAVTRDAVTERDLDLQDNVTDLGSLKEPSAEAILTADLDFVILMSSLPNHVAMAETLEKTGIDYAYFDVENFSDYLELMKLFTDMTGRGDLNEGQSQLEASLTFNPIWDTWQAVQNGRVFYLEKELFHQKPNARWGESYEILAQLLSQ